MHFPLFVGFQRFPQWIYYNLCMRSLRVTFGIGDCCAQLEGDLLKLQCYGDLSDFFFSVQSICSRLTQVLMVSFSL